MNGDTEFVGIVENGTFQQFIPALDSRDHVRFTSIQPQEAVTPESGELDLTQYEGGAIMIHGLDQGNWVYSAQVVDQAGPILTAVVSKVFGKSGQQSQAVS